MSEKKRCKNCGGLIMFGWVFCHRCGESFDFEEVKNEFGRKSANI